MARSLVLGLLAIVLTSILLVASSPPSANSASLAPQPFPQLANAVPQAARSDVSVRSLQVGIAGTIETDILTADLTGNGEVEVILGTSRGVYILSGGTLLQYIPTSSSVLDVALLDDVTGDGQAEIAVAVGDTFFPNIRVYDSATGARVWQFVPAQEVFIENLMWTEQQTLTFDLETVDVNSDGVTDVIATSGYRVYALDGKTGDQIWNFEASDNLWRIAVTPDLNSDGVPDLAVGGQNGSMYALSGMDGLLLWQTRLVPKYDVINFEQGSIMGTVDRSVWDIVPVNFLGMPWAVVSAEDGYVRLVDLREGTVQWEYQAFEHVDALLSRYYPGKGMNATSPGDFHFFNLRVFLTPDITGDGVEEILAAAYLGRRSERQQETRGAGLFLINPVTGRALWENISLELEGVGQMEITSLDGEPVILLPSGSVTVIDLQDGQPVLDDSDSGSSRESWYVAKDLGGGELLLASTYGDLVSVSVSGEVMWDYPGVADVALERGDFTGDDTEDILVRSQIFLHDPEPRARVLYVIDGATGEMAWSYVMPYEEFAVTGGIGGIQVTPDLNQDGKQDIIGYIQPPGEKGQPSGEGEPAPPPPLPKPLGMPKPQVGGGEKYGGIPQIVVLSGEDGSILLKQPVVAQTYYGIWEELYTDPAALEQRILARFEADMEQRLPEQWVRHQREAGDDFERRQLPEQWDRHQEDRRNEFEQQLQAELERLRGEGWAEEDLERLRGGGWAEEDLGGWQKGQWDDFEQQLQGERESWEQEMRDDFELQLPEMKADMERQWREDFEEYQLPDRLEQWQERLDNEEEHRRIDKWINSLDVIQIANNEEEGIALVVGTGRDIFIVSPAGELLWTRTSEPGNYQDPFTGEEAQEMLFGGKLKDPRSALYRVPGDLNGDGIDDLVVFTSQEIVVGLSTMEDGELGFERGPVIELEQGMDPRQGKLVDDLDGDGVRDIFYLRGQEGRRPTGIFVSTATGRELLRVEELEGSDVALGLASADLDGDGNADTLLYRGFEGREGVWLQVVSGRGRSVIWEITYQEGGEPTPRPLGGGGGGKGYAEGPLPAAPISDITGDGVADLAIVQNLVWQAGAKVVIYDVARDEIVKEIVLEEIGSAGGRERPEAREQRWQPGLLVGEVGDVTGDGVKELAVVTALGDTERTKEYRLMVVDVIQGQVVADFRLTGSELFDLGGASEFGVLGLTGEVYLVDVANDLQITSPPSGSPQTSPVTIQWTGVTAGAFNQVFVDGVEVARTNENEFTLPVAQGEHQVAIRSLDESGRGVYRTASFTVEKSSSVVTGAIGAMVLLFAIALGFPVSGFVTRYLRRRGRNG